MKRSKKKALSQKPSASTTKYRYAEFEYLKSTQLGEEFGGVLIPRGEKVLMPINLDMGERKLTRRLEDLFKVVGPKINLNNKKVLVIRYGGIGDILASLYAIAELKIKYPEVQIGFMGSIKYVEILRAFPKLVQQIFTGVTSIRALKQYKYMVCLDDTLELSESATTTPMHDIYAKQFGVTVSEDTTLLVNATNITLEENSRRLGIGIQYKSNAILRDYGIEKFIEVINILGKQYPSKPIFLLGPPDDHLFANYIQAKTDGRVIPNGGGMQSRSLPELLQLIARLEVVIGPDSSMLHMAGVCATPMVGIFGPFPSNLRIQYYSKAIGIDAMADCSPCFRHFPVDFCKFNNSRGECLASISPEVIVQQAKKFLT